MISAIAAITINTTGAPVVHRAAMTATPTMIAAISAPRTSA